MDQEFLFKEGDIVTILPSKLKLTTGACYPHYFTVEMEDDHGGKKAKIIEVNLSHPRVKIEALECIKALPQNLSTNILIDMLNLDTNSDGNICSYKLQFEGSSQPSSYTWHSSMFQETLTKVLKDDNIVDMYL